MSQLTGRRGGGGRPGWDRRQNFSNESIWRKGRFAWKCSDSVRLTLTYCFTIIESPSPPLTCNSWPVMRPNKSFSLQLFYRQSTSSERAFVLLIKCQARGCCPNFWQIHVTLRFKSKAGRIGIRDGWSCHWKNQRRLMFQTVADERGSVSSTKRKFLFSLLWSGNTDSWCWSGRKMAVMGKLIYSAKLDIFPIKRCSRSKGR